MTTAPCVYIVDDDGAVRNGLRMFLETAGLKCKTFADAEQFLAQYRPEGSGCLILDVNLPGLNGPQLQRELNRLKIRLPIIFLTAYGDIPMSVRAIQAGAVDFLTKPIQSDALIKRILEVLDQEAEKEISMDKEQGFHGLVNTLTEREMEILPLAIAGIPNKEIGHRLGISHRTVEVHRIRILKKTGCQNFLELSRLCEINNFALKTKI
ncbi:nodulation protein W [Methyloglobulus morosus KoM1]|uniref:Nodulation protein W n=1 Tax=Methyloglobulus morosus KoM1 TaxID=1116472 RepID=V5DWK0_9GAMM|nr:response regulator [Methyloglobulus morosus]ESS71716.1 nodulation protein W [Methyloglobulus morosus KoM1]